MFGLKWSLIAILASLSCFDAANILLVFTFPGKSHGILADGFVRVLLAAGHEVSVVCSATFLFESLIRCP